MVIFQIVFCVILLVGMACAYWLGKSRYRRREAPVFSPFLLLAAFFLASTFALAIGDTAINDVNRGPAGTAYNYTHYTSVVAGLDNDKGSRWVFTNSGHRVAVDYSAVTPLGQPISFSCAPSGLCKSDNRIVRCAKPCVDVMPDWLFYTWAGAIALVFVLPYVTYNLRGRW